MNLKEFRKQLKELTKQSRVLFKKAAWSLFLFMLCFSVVQDILLNVVVGNIWSLTLMTTPDGFISNANLVNTLIRCPWVIVIGLMLVVIYAAISMWQVTATILGIGYIYNEKTFTLRELFKQSLIRVYKSFRPYNWSILLYSMIIVPFSNIFQSSRMIEAYVIPEYIQDFINSKLSLSLVITLLMLVMVYLALRWFYVLPLFILKNKKFPEARAESYKLTKVNFFKNGFWIGIYNVKENI